VIRLLKIPGNVRGPWKHNRGTSLGKNSFSIFFDVLRCPQRKTYHSSGHEGNRLNEQPNRFLADVLRGQLAQVSRFAAGLALGSSPTFSSCCAGPENRLARRHVEPLRVEQRGLLRGCEHAERELHPSWSRQAQGSGAVTRRDGHEADDAVDFL